MPGAIDYLLHMHVRVKRAAAVMSDEQDSDVLLGISLELHFSS
jgi:hypothetical protein